MFRVARNVLNCPLLLSPSVGSPSTLTTKGRILHSLCNRCGWTVRIRSTAQLETNPYSSVKHNHEFYSRMTTCFGLKKTIIKPPLQIYIYIMLILRYGLYNKIYLVTHRITEYDNPWLRQSSENYKCLWNIYIYIYKDISIDTFTAFL
jgi:hypothetical protein